MGSGSTPSGVWPQRPSSTARSVPCPLPVNASEPKSSATTRVACASLPSRSIRSANRPAATLRKVLGNVREWAVVILLGEAYEVAQASSQSPSVPPGECVRMPQTDPAVESPNHHRILILGSGPAGLTAALYAARADLK